MAERYTQRRFLPARNLFFMISAVAVICASVTLACCSFHVGKRK